MRFARQMHCVGTTRFGLCHLKLERPRYLGYYCQSSKVDSSAILYLR